MRRRPDRVERVHRGDETEARAACTRRVAHVDLALAHHRDDTLRVSSGIRLISSTYSREPSRMAVTRGPSTRRRAYPSFRTQPIEVADQPRRGQLRVALHELEPEAQTMGPPPAGAWTCRCRRAFEQTWRSRRAPPARARARAADRRPRRQRRQQRRIIIDDDPRMFSRRACLVPSLIWSGCSLGDQLVELS